MEWLEAHVAQIWFLIIGFFVLYYAVADGYDLGVGIIALFTQNEEKRGIMMASLQSVWQENQTWLVVLGGMLFGLIFRGIAFEFRDHSKTPSLWSLSFGIGSLITALSQGFTLGGIFYGIPMEGYNFTGTIWSWFHPYSILFTLGVLSGYIMLGANYLIMKTSGVIQRRSVLHSYLATCSTLIISISIYIWTIARHPYMARKWLDMPGLIYVAVFPLFALLSLVMYLRSLHKRSEVAPLLWNVTFVLCAFIGLSVGFYPYIIPNMVTIKSAAVSSSNTLIFMLAVTIILLPLVLAYIGYKNWIFRGKVGNSGYGD